MIQAVADDEERGSIGMHYTSVPNILKVLNPLFLDDLRESLQEAGDNSRKLVNLRKRISRIRVFDPACGSGNFLVIAYKEMRQIESEINNRRYESHLRSEIPISNFRGIELREFATEIARLALIIAEYQCDEQHRGQKDALADFLPLDSENWIVHGNALRIDWLSVCPPTEKVVEHFADDFFHKPQDQAQIDFANEGGETYICGNPPYRGTKRQSDEQKADLEALFDHRLANWRSLDYVAGWFLKAADYGSRTITVSAFVSTNSICQGQQVPILWPEIFQTGNKILFAHTSFKWANLASYNAGVTVVIIGITTKDGNKCKLSYVSNDGESLVRQVSSINAYLTSGSSVIVTPHNKPLSNLPEMARGNSPTDGGHLLLESHELDTLLLTKRDKVKFIRNFVGSRELISGSHRYCIWIDDHLVDSAAQIPAIKSRIEAVRQFRLKSKKRATVKAAEWSYRFDERKPISKSSIICVPVISSENRPFLPVTLLSEGTVISNKAFSISGSELWPLSIICSKLNISWVSAVCAKMRTDYSYTNTLGWNTFPVPKLTEKNKLDLTRCAENILLAREKHFPETIAELYDHTKPMHDDLRQAHEKNDETLERIYIGRRFNNDTERLEKLFELYTKMTSSTTSNNMESAS
jgi:hypothetical protein